MQNDSVQLHGFTDKHFFAPPINSSIVENGDQFGNHTFKPSTIPEEETTNDHFIKNEYALDNPDTVEATDYASER